LVRLTIIFIALDCRTGKVVWKYKTDGKMVVNSPTIYENMLFIGTVGGSFYAIDIESGNKIWVFRAGEGLTTKPLFYNNRIYFTSIDGNLYCLSLEGKEIWRFKTGKEIFYPPSAWEGRIYFGSCDGNFYCVRSDDGKEIWRFATSDTNISRVDPPYKIFEVVIKKMVDKQIEEGKERYAADFSNKLSDDVYSIRSEYVTEVTYSVKKDYGA